MGILKLFGSGDDLIEVEGDLSVEFRLPASNKAYLAISDGSVYEATYTRRGVWRFKLLNGWQAWTDEKIVPAEGPETSDRITLEATNPFTWVMLGTHFETTEKQ
jgi:hypothetical protein